MIKQNFRDRKLWRKEYVHKTMSDFRQKRFIEFFFSVSSECKKVAEALKEIKIPQVYHVDGIIKESHMVDGIDNIEVTGVSWDETSNNR